MRATKQRVEEHTLCIPLDVLDATRTERTPVTHDVVYNFDSFEQGREVVAEQSTPAYGSEQAQEFERLYRMDPLKRNVRVVERSAA